MMAWLCWILAAQAAEHRVVRAGETIESIAVSLGNPALAAEIRSLNHIAAGANPPPGAVLHLPGGATASSDQDSEVLAVEGHGTATLPGQKDPITLAPRQKLPIGSQVCTDAESFATIRLARDPSSYDHDDVSLLPNTCLTVVGAAAAPGRRSSVIAVSEGAVTVIGTENTPGNVIVQTPVATTSGDEGGFRVTLEPGATRTEAVTAPVAVYAQGAEVVLEAKQGVRVREGEAPATPRGLLAAGALFLPEEGTPLRWPDFHWQSVSRALGYRVQIATGPEFSEIVAQVDVPFPEWEPDYLLLPYRVAGYWWRVTPLDRFGFEGTPSTGRRLRVPAGVGP